jgi:hypothetical protein
MCECGYEEKYFACTINQGPPPSTQLQCVREKTLGRILLLLLRKYYHQRNFSWSILQLHMMYYLDLGWVIISYSKSVADLCHENFTVVMKDNGSYV